jgi:protease IV
LLAIFAFFIILAVLVAGIISSAGKDDPAVVSANSIMHIKLDYPINERTSKNPLDKVFMAEFEGNENLGLNDLLANIKSAKSDDNLKGIYLDLTNIQAGYATIEEIRNALLDFKRSGKFITAYSEVYSQNAYYLASVANKIYLNPEGFLEFKGFSSQIAFFKGALEKLGIEPQVIKVGTYKSAVEPFILDKMSDPNRKQVSSFLNSMYGHFISKISESRKIPQDSLLAIANQLKVQNASDAVKYKLADGLKYKDQVLDELKSLTGVEKKKSIKAVSIQDYNGDSNKDGGSSDNRIAVVYAFGDIITGEGNDERIGSERISRAIRKVREDEKVKALVLRVNSPGGSALASDVIWREVLLTKKIKPVIVSMGDVAASGGYYIACAADSIFAQPNTITGSIGVFGIIPNMQNFFNNKLGITFDQVKTGEFADIETVTRPLSEAEKRIIQNEVNRIYNSFTKHVAEGRKKDQRYIDSIGQGRVWSGSEAVKIGLVDRLGNINDAVQSAAKMAKLKDYKLVSYPALKDPFSSILGGSTDKIREYFTKRELGDQYRYYQQVKDALELKGIQARLPYTISIN